MKTLLIGALITFTVFTIVFISIVIWYHNYTKHDQERVNHIVEEVREKLSKE